MADERKIVLSAKDIEVKFRVRENYLTAIRGVSLDLYDGETFAIVGRAARENPSSPRPSPACWKPTG